MKYEDWVQLTDAERASLQKQWNAYGEGYWHELVGEAATRFRAEFGHTPHVVNIHSGVHHGGELIIGVNTNLSYPHKASLPETYAGFRVLQFCAA
ncbi:MAG TPA: hypothetical protein VHV54_08350 [Candidatus Binatia bacterium]|nr:hypothetical protein [Candidatus Binatia bacterium]